MKQVYARTWGILPEDGKENTYRLRQLLEDIRLQKDIEIIFEPGRYHFYPDYAVEKLLYISNHDEDTIKKVAFDLSGFERVTLSGEKTEFLFHSDIIPFHIHNSVSVTIRRIVIDYARPVYSQAYIESVDEKRAVLCIDPKEYPFFVRHGRLFFTGEGFCSEITHGCLEMDGERKAPVYDAGDIAFNLAYGYPSSQALGAVFTRLSETQVEVSLMEESESLNGRLRAGNDLILRHHARTHPAFYITDSKQVMLEDITLYHCSGMAVIAQFTDGITIRGFNLCRHPERKTVFTATADGFHFVYCRGLLHITECLLENQLDDPVNIHGIYGRVHKILNEKEMLVELVENMQKGVLLGHVGDVFSVVENETLLETGRCKVEAIEMLNKDYMHISVDRLPQDMKAGYVIENQDYIPDVLIEHCTFRNNRARGLLLTSGGHVLVRNNHFETAGAAILIEGDCNYWFESGAVKDVKIEHNCFLNCAYVSPWGAAPIQISPQVQKFRTNQFYHGHIQIRENEFYCFDQRILSAVGVDTIDFVGNKVYQTDAFLPIKGEAFVVKEVGMFNIEGE